MGSRIEGVIRSTLLRTGGSNFGSRPGGTARRRDGPSGAGFASEGPGGYSPLTGYRSRLFIGGRRPFLKRYVSSSRGGRGGWSGPVEGRGSPGGRFGSRSGG